MKMWRQHELNTALGRPGIHRIYSSSNLDFRAEQRRDAGGNVEEGAEEGIFNDRSMQRGRKVCLLSSGVCFVKGKRESERISLTDTFIFVRLSSGSLRMK